MNAPLTHPAPARRTATLATGTLELTVAEGDHELDRLIGLGARANPKRGFLFVSKALGKHWPSRPSDMLAVQQRLAAGVPKADGPVVFIALAETAVGLGQGVFEAWLRDHPGSDALFLHSTRYRIGDSPLIAFDEPHSHAPRQFLHLPAGPRALALLMAAKMLVLVDDEASTGITLANLAWACRRLNPAIEHVHLAVIADFAGGANGSARTQRFDTPITVDALLHGEHRFTPNGRGATAAPAQLPGTTPGNGASGRLGRLGLTRALPAPERLADALARQIGAGERVLVLGTGEFMHGPTLLARELERRGVDVVVQSTTRSPVLVGGAIGCAISFPDNYGEGILNYLYNLRPGQYEHVLVCHETAPGAILRDLATRLHARLIHFIDETHIEALSDLPVF